MIDISLKKLIEARKLYNELNDRVYMIINSDFEDTKYHAIYQNFNDTVYYEMVDVFPEQAEFLREYFDTIILDLAEKDMVELICDGVHEIISTTGSLLNFFHNSREKEITYVEKY